MLLRTIAGASLLLAAVWLAYLDAALWLLPVMFCGAYAVLFLLAFLFLCAVCAVVDLDKPQEHDSKFYRTVMHLYIEALISLVRLKVEVSGLEKTPKEGRFLLVCNHQNESDPGILLHYFKKSQLAFISKRENATMFAVGKFMHKIMCQLVNRENDREALKTILKCIQLIRDDEVSIGAFPEGGILVENKLSHFRSGMFKIAQKTGVPIVVCTLKGTSDLFRNLKGLKPTHVRLHLVDVIPAEEVKGANTVELGERIYNMMLADLGPEYALIEDM
ncbi:MAG: 1-acyl-sn-glycerol-3-phosphate acyltransferase [Oscillospiraceae bacterium]|nr:1-acyl-sn-glycerol-3-phosphate acyltransferase [Oscillospiraceae bacterium]